MQQRYHVLALGFAVLTFLNAPVHAQSEATLFPSKDNTIYEESGSSSNGAGDHLFVGNTRVGNARRALLQFDVASAIPEGAQVQSASLTVTVSRAASGGVLEVNVHRLTRDWGAASSNASGAEGTGAAAASGDATWTHAFFNTQTWQANGGDFAAAPSASFSLGASGSSGVASSAGLVSDVQGWVDDPSTNFGWILRGDELSNQNARRIESSEGGSQTSRPTLRVTYTVNTSSEQPDRPQAFTLEGNYPNPFSRLSSIRYELERVQDVRFELFDVTGRPVRTIERRAQAPGPQEIEIDGANLASGLYIYCLSTDESRSCRTLTVLK